VSLKLPKYFNKNETYKVHFCYNASVTADFTIYQQVANKL